MRDASSVCSTFFILEALLCLLLALLCMSIPLKASLGFMHHLGSVAALSARPSNSGGLGNSRIGGGRRPGRKTLKLLPISNAEVELDLYLQRALSI